MTDDKYKWVGMTAYRSWNRGEKCIEINPAMFEGVLCWRVIWFKVGGATHNLIFNREHDFESVKREVQDSVFEIELRDAEND